MSDLARREFLRRTAILVTGSLFISCEDEKEKAEPDSPGGLTGKGSTKDVIIVGAGSAGAALAAYCAAAHIKADVFCPDDTPTVNVREIALQGARTWLVNGLINDCGRIVGEGVDIVGWFDTSTLKEPYRIEGKKTMGLERAEQLGRT